MAKPVVAASDGTLGWAPTGSMGGGSCSSDTWSVCWPIAISAAAGGAPEEDGLAGPASFIDVFRGSVSC